MVLSMSVNIPNIVRHAFKAFKPLRGASDLKNVGLKLAYLFALCVYSVC